jgi:hypothetical protein
MNKLVIVLVLFGAVGAQAARKDKYCPEDPFVSTVQHSQYQACVES